MVAITMCSLGVSKLRYKSLIMVNKQGLLTRLSSEKETMEEYLTSDDPSSKQLPNGSQVDRVSLVSVSCMHKPTHQELPVEPSISKIKDRQVSNSSPSVSYDDLITLCYIGKYTRLLTSLSR